MRAAVPWFGLAGMLLSGLLATPGCGADDEDATGGGGVDGSVTTGGSGGSVTTGGSGAGVTTGGSGGGQQSGGTGGSGALATGGAGGAGGGNTGGTGGVGGGTAGNGGVAGADGSSAGTSGAAGSDGTGATGGASTGGTAGTDGGTCVGDWVAGDYPPGITQETYLQISGVAGQQGLTRQYKVHVPPSYDCTVQTPVVFCLHGLSQTPVQFCVNGSGYTGGTGFPSKADEAGFILVMPFGYSNSWNGAGCCGTAASMGLDDVALMRAILQELQTHVNVDAGRVYSTGFSNGGYMSYRLACEAADVFTAVAPGAGGLQASYLSGCNPSRPIALLDIHGTLDTLVPYSLQQPSLERVAAQNGCSNTTAPASQPTSGGDTTCISYAGCPSGVEVTGCTVTGGGHVWFGDPSCGTGAGALGCGFVGANSNHMVNTVAIWDFFSRHSR